jgi:hypothetical protein
MNTSFFVYDTKAELIWAREETDSIRKKKVTQRYSGIKVTGG